MCMSDVCESPNSRYSRSSSCGGACCGVCAARDRPQHDGHLKVLKGIVITHVYVFPFMFYLHYRKTNLKHLIRPP